MLNKSLLDVKWKRLATLNDLSNGFGILKCTILSFSLKTHVYVHSDSLTGV